MTTTDTPRTDAACGQGRHGAMKIPYETSCQLERELNASKAEVERLKEDRMRLIAYCADLLEKINPSL